LADATIEVVSQLGCAQATPALICERADLSLADFYRTFPAMEKALELVFEEQFRRLLGRCQLAYEAEEEWLDGLRSLAVELARWVNDHPREARFTLVGSLSAGEQVALQREAAMARFAELVDQGRELCEEPDAVPRCFAVAVVGAVAELLTRRLSGCGPISTAELERAVPELMFFAVRPYASKGQADRELERAVRL
jgi:AcrR family transcriptional regulator